jgi:ABC-type Mn2+/Zn2+ transport system permease subunit
LSNWLDVQTGATIVLVLGGLFVLAYLVSPRYGLLGTVLRRQRPSHGA